MFTKFTRQRVKVLVLSFIMGEKLVKDGFAAGKALDVLILETGPAGFMAVAALARHGVPSPIIDKLPQQILRGHAC